MALLVAAVLLGAGCTQGGSNYQGSAQNGKSGAIIASGGNVGAAAPSSADTASTANSGASAGGQVREVSVVAKSFTFTPDTITVKQGERVRITLTATDVPHGIGVAEFNFSLVANAGETKTGEFTASKAGNYTFFCNVFCGSGHRDMKGTLVVTP